MKMNKLHLTKKLAAKIDVTLQESRDIITGFLEVVMEELAEGNSVTLSSIGILKVVLYENRKEVMVFGKKHPCPPSLKVRLTPTIALKEQMAKLYQKRQLQKSNLS